MEKKSTNSSSKSKRTKVSTDKDKVVITEKIDTSKTRHRIYFSYNFRLVTSIISFVVFFLLALFFMMRSFSFKSGDSINYQEKSNHG